MILSCPAWNRLKTIRAVKFILDQAEALFPESQDQGRKSWNASSGAYAAAHVLRKMLIRDDRKSEDDSVGISMRDANPAVSRLDPSLGWNQKDVYTERGHFCLLIKPQIVLQSEKSSDSTVVLASTNMSLQVHTIIDRANVSDPVNGPIMTRYSTVSCLSLQPTLITEHTPPFADFKPSRPLLPHFIKIGTIDAFLLKCWSTTDAKVPTSIGWFLRRMPRYSTTNSIGCDSAIMSGRLASTTLKVYVNS
jgi:hypothetical protein